MSYLAEHSRCNIAEDVAEAACRALTSELETYPKPGLVSPVDNGSHPDMTYGHFEASIAALRPWFSRFAMAGYEGADFRTLKGIGMAAEMAMLAATDGRNTHRGAIFSLGLLTAAAGARDSWEHWRSSRLGEIVKHLWGPVIPSPHDLPPASHGTAVCQRYGLSGVRGEATAGFPSVYRHGLPYLRESVRETPDNSQRVQLFFLLLAACEDTTTLHRGGMAGLIHARTAARGFLASGGTARVGWREKAIAIHEDFVARDLTAGGTADLMAAALFVAETEAR